MLDSLIALRDFEGVEGLPPLNEIEDVRYEKNLRKSTRAEIECQKQEEVAKARVRDVDDKGRAYGTGRRKCTITRVWIQPGDGKFVVNDKQFDVYFPMLDHRAAPVRPFSETKTLGLWDVRCCERRRCFRSSGSNSVGDQQGLAELGTRPTSIPQSWWFLDGGTHVWLKGKIREKQKQERASNGSNVDHNICNCFCTITCL